MKKLLFVIIVLAMTFPTAGQIYSNLIDAGDYAYKLADYDLARYFYKEAMKRIPEDSLIDIYVTNQRLRETDRRRIPVHGQAAFEEAEEYGRKTIDWMRKVGITNRGYLMEEYAMHALTYSVAPEKDMLNAYCYLDSACQTVSGPDATLQNRYDCARIVGMIYTKFEDFDKAEEAYALGVKLMKEGDFSADSKGTTLNLYGNILFKNNKYHEALETYRLASDLYLSAEGENSKNFQWVNYNIANLLAYMGKIDEGSQLYDKVIGWYRESILHDLQSMSVSRRDKYLGDMIDIIQDAIPFGVEAKYNEDEFTRLAYEGLLLSKGLQLATDRSTDAIIRKYGTVEEKDVLDTLKRMKVKFSDLRSDTASDPVEIMNLYAKIITNDISLAKASSGYGNNTSFAAVGYEELKNGLKDDEVILDFADYKPKSKPRQYVCFEIRRNQKYPKVHYICNGAQLDSLLELENHVWSNLYTGESGEEMAKIITRPLREIIGDCRKVYYVPSGIFHKLSVEAIPDGDGLLGDRIDFRRLSSAREILQSPKILEHPTACIFGGLNYDSDSGSRSDATKRGEKKLDFLPYSLEEVENISALIPGSKLSVGNNGTEDIFKEMSGGSPDIIHVSTHGFYYSPDDKEKPASLQGYNDAMTLSGLVMSGGNAGWTGVEKSEGILTAEEISGCDLTDTSLVCLASCHSGEGEVTSEGIYGMQRAFKKAGVGTVILSLWTASDVATKCFMTNFYEDLINGSKDRYKAFRYARDKVREQYTSPYYWAGFIMVD